MRLISEVIKMLFRKRFTVKYPQERLDLKFRGKVFWDKNLCIFCGTCERVCPPKAITMKDRKEIKINDFKCIYCGYCEENCPVPEKAIKLTSKIPEIRTR